MSRRFLLPLLLAVVPANVAIADEKYETLFKEGRARMESRDYDRACELFKESLDVGAPIGALLNLADCEDKRGQWARSLSLWKEGLSKLPSDDKRRDIAQRAIDDVDRRVAKIAVVWPAAPADAKAFVDGKAAKIGGDPEPVDPGAHKVTATSGGGSRTVDLTVRSGELKSVDLSSKEARSPPNKSLLFGAIASFGVAGAAAIGAAISGGVYLSAKSTIDRACPDRSNCNDANALAAKDRGRTAGAANIAMFVVAAAGAGIGTTLVVIHATKSRSSDAAAPSAELELTGPGVRLVGSF